MVGFQAAVTRSEIVGLLEKLPIFPIIEAMAGSAISHNGPVQWNRWVSKMLRIRKIVSGTPVNTIMNRWRLQMEEAPLFCSVPGSNTIAAASKPVGVSSTAK